jgi:tetratricopeptide (TPR) repeat protein
MNRKFYLPVLLLVFSHAMMAAPGRIDSLSKALLKAHTDTSRAILLRQLSAEYKSFNPDTALELSQRSLILARRADFLTGESDALNEMASAYGSMDNYPKALEYYLMQLKLVEDREDFPELARINMNISNVYQREGDHIKALTYALMSNKIIEAQKIESLRFYSYLNLGDIYVKLKDVNSALINTNKAFAIAKSNGDKEFIGACLNNIGNIYLQRGEEDRALKSYREAIPFLTATNRNDFLGESLMGVSQILFKTGQVDSAIAYAEQSLKIARGARFAGQALIASNALNQYYSKAGRLDIAYQYQSEVIAIKDSLYSQERVKQLQNLTIVENMRQKEMAELKMLEKEERAKRLQLLLVGLLIPLSFLVSILLSKRKIKPRFVEFSGIVSLLLFFEYITMLIHPWVMEVTHHTPAYEIIIFVVIAAIITPSHHKFEHWLITKLTLHTGRKYQHTPHQIQEENAN